MKNFPHILLGLLLVSGLALAAENNTQSAEAVKRQLQNSTPYDTSQTVETFSKTVHGGVLHVVVKSPGNTAQIKLVQAHLQKMAEQFRKGDFAQTEKMHGADMPGLAHLKTAKPDEIRYEYKSLENGGQIHFTSEYAQHIEALHEWFDAQIKEHGNPEVPGHGQHHATPVE